MANQFRMQAPSWIGPVTAVSLILGFLIVTAWKLPKDESATRLYPNRTGLAAAGPGIEEPIGERENEIKRLRDKTTELEQAIADRSKQTKLLNDSLQETKMLAGLTEVEGPGIEIILRDSVKSADDPLRAEEYVIHDTDILRVVNELWMSGAEAIAINKQRLTYKSSFMCAGNVIYVDRVPVSSPVRIRAIGDAETLYGALTMQGRYLSTIKQADSAMVEVTKRDRMILPAFTGSTKFDYAKSVDISR